MNSYQKIERRSVLDFQIPYEREQFCHFLRNFLSQDYKTYIEEIKIDGSPKYIKKAYLIGKDQDLNLEVYEIHHKGIHDPRISLARETFDLMAKRGIKNALGIFLPQTNSQYRLSLLSIDLKLQDGKIVKEYSNPKRFSYLLGPEAKIHTPKERLSERIKNLQDLKERFSVEVVNKDFYKGISEYFRDLIENLRLPSTDDEIHKKTFAIRLIGRVIFLWFLKKKRSIQGSPVIPEELICANKVKEQSDYYHSVLEPLFFEVLNKQLDERLEKYTGSIYSKIPFLNGGIFSPKSHDYYELNELGFSSYLNTLKIEDRWFEEFFNFLDTYNFTIDESTPIDVELSIDPEMLGRIFENLLAEIVPETGETARKLTGSYYTPREVVDFIVERSLCYHLAEKTNMEMERVEKLISYTDDIILDELEKKKIIDTILNTKVLDPACGSGAFPMGLLQRCVWILEKIDPDAILWKESILDAVKDTTVRRILKDKFDKSTAQYIRKLKIIENCIYGVDIQEIAVELARLRFFLSLIIDEQVDEQKPNMNIEPLPNLEFKFICADSLIDLKQEQIPLYLRIDELKKIMDEYFTASSTKEKKELEEKFRNKQEELIKQFLDWVGNWQGKNYQQQNALKILNWDPFGDDPAGFFNPSWFFGLKDRFDIVLGNPPYIQLQKDHGKLAEKYQDQGYETFTRTGDIYCLFYERGIKLLKNSGILCYITSNKWMRTAYGEKLRQFFAKYDPLELIDLGPNVFESATVDTNILLVRKSQRSDHILRAVNYSNREKSILQTLKENAVVISKLTKDVWFVGNIIEYRLKEKIENIGKPLKDWNVKIYRGVLTGLNEAFIIDTQTRDQILTNCKDEDEKHRTEKIIKPILRGRDIKRYCYEWAGLWVIGTFPALHLDIEEYPSLKGYLLDHFDIRQLEQSGEKYLHLGFNARKKTGNKWFETQDQIAYYHEFEKEKVIYSEIVRQPQFHYDKEKFYVEATGFLMIVESAMYICGLLNSKPVSYFFKKWYAGGGLGEEGFRYKKVFLENLPIPYVNEFNKNKNIVKDIESLVDQITNLKKQKGCSADTSRSENEIDHLIYQLYGLTDQEIKIIESS